MSDQHKVDLERDVPLPLHLRSDFRAITVPEAAVLLGFSKTYSYTLAARGDIPTIRVGSRLRVPVKALEKMLKIKPAA